MIAALAEIIARYAAPTGWDGDEGFDDLPCDRQADRSVGEAKRFVVHADGDNR